MQKHPPTFFIREEYSEVEKVAQRQRLLEDLTGKELTETNTFPFDVQRVGTRNCENLVGSVSIPVGVIGPVSYAYEFEGSSTAVDAAVIPLATTEGALVASLNRGAKAVAAAGGVIARVKRVGMSRAPVFVSSSAAAATAFAAWVEKHEQLFEDAAVATSGHLHFLRLITFVEGTYSFVRVSFDTQDAMGMNMVSVALDYWWTYLVPEEVKSDTRMIALSGNVCVDKKPSTLNRELGRGFWITTEVTLSEEILQRIFKIDSEVLLETHRAKNEIGCRIAGTPAQNMHVANAVAAVFLATGQDPAHVVDVASAASVDFVKVQDGVKVVLDMPTIPVGSIGGGTVLPQQHEFLGVALGTQNRSVVLAVVVSVATLCGEISGLAALSNHTLASAHNQLARGKKAAKKNGGSK